MITEADNVVHTVGVIRNDNFVHAVVVHAVAEGIAHAMMLFTQNALLMFIML